MGPPVLRVGLLGAGRSLAVYNNGVPTSVRQFNTPVVSKNVAKVTGFFFQDSWSMNRLTLNLGGRWDKYVGTLPEQSSAGRPLRRAAHACPRQEVHQPEHRACGALGASYDLTGSGRTALKASYSRYGLQVGIDRVHQRQPADRRHRDCPWTDPNGDGRFQESEVNVAQCPAFSGGVDYRYADGIDWPYSDEVTAGIETQLPGAVRVGAMFYYRTNRDQFGQRNTLQPTSAYTPHTRTIPNGPGGTRRQPEADDRRRLQHQRRGQRAERQRPRQRRLPRHRLQGRRVHRHQALLAEVADAGGLHHRQERGRRQPPARHNDLNDPNITLFPTGIIGNDSETALPPVGQLRAAVATSTWPAR